MDQTPEVKEGDAMTEQKILDIRLAKLKVLGKVIAVNGKTLCKIQRVYRYYWDISNGREYFLVQAEFFVGRVWVYDNPCWGMCLANQGPRLPVLPQMGPYNEPISD